jgi:truncated hemoglobin YjbI
MEGASANPNVATLHRAPQPHDDEALATPLAKEHFERWLFLWQANCRTQLPMDVDREMIDLAHHVAHKLRNGP